jgi:hypothetical protein
MSELLTLSVSGAPEGRGAHHAGSLILRPTTTNWRIGRLRRQVPWALDIDLSSWVSGPLDESQSRLLLHWLSRARKEESAGRHTGEKQSYKHQRVETVCRRCRSQAPHLPVQKFPVAPVHLVPR